MLKTENYKIVLIGAGNVATQLGIALTESKHTIVQVYSKQRSSSETLAKLLKCEHTNIPEKIDQTADIYIIAVNDDAIVDVVKQLKLSGQIVVHTSGSVDMKVLKSASKNYGVFYPLQTFSKTKKAEFKNIPICLEANNTHTLTVLQSLGKSISNNVQIINSEQRKTIHVAAVFACNFSNHFYSIASDILGSKHLSLDILKPLIEETANKIKDNSPAEMQTGPAIRGDKKTMTEHLKLIKNKEQKQLYKLISKHIMETSKTTKITVEAIINAPIEKVWDMWNQPEHVTKWCFASDDWHAPFAKSDLRVGGKSVTTMAAKDGSFSFDFEWTYTKFDKHETIEYTITDGRTVAIQFSNTPKGVKITETFEAENQNPVEMQKSGWQAILNNFKKYVEGN